MRKALDVRLLLFTDVGAMLRRPISMFASASGGTPPDLLPGFLVFICVRTFEIFGGGFHLAKVRFKDHGQVAHETNARWCLRYKAPC